VPFVDQTAAPNEEVEKRPEIPVINGQTKRKIDRVDQLHLVLLSLRAELVPGVLDWQSLSVGKIVGHIKAEPGKQEKTWPEQ
jgi:hypothetical protein